MSGIIRSMDGLTFELARIEHAKAIESMRQASADDLTVKLGTGYWTGSSKIASIRERIKLADPETLRKSTIYVALRGDEVVGSVVVSTFPPGFWRREFWSEGKAPALGVFNLVVFPHLQGQGIGRFLMDGTEQLARKHGLPFVRLDAFAENPHSNAFYHAIGYEERAVIDLRGCGLVLFEKRIV